METTFISNALTGTSILVWYLVTLILIFLTCAIIGNLHQFGKLFFPVSLMYSIAGMDIHVAFIILGILIYLTTLIGQDPVEVLMRGAFVKERKQGTKTVTVFKGGKPQGDLKDGDVKYYP